MFNVFKPTLWTIVLAGILFFLSDALWQVYVLLHISDTFPAGFPFEFWVAWGPCPPGQNCSEFHGLNLILDLIIWYIVSAFIVNGVRKRS